MEDKFEYKVYEDEKPLPQATADREKLIELIKDGISCPDNGNPFEEESCTSCKYCDDDECNFTRIADYLIANGVTVQKWIPVTERLPDKEFWEHNKLYEDEDLEVQVMIKGAKRATTLLYNAEGEFYATDADGGTFYVVTHWAPLMEPPKEG